MNTGLLLLAGFFYACLFWIVTARSPRLALFFILAAAPFQQDLSGGGPVKFSLAEINLLLCLPVVLFRARNWRFNPSIFPAMLYLAVGVVCSLQHWRGTTITSLLQVCIYLMVVVTVFASLARSEEDCRLALQGFVATCTFLAILTVGLGTARVFGLHKNGLGGSLGTAFVISFELWMSSRERRRRWAYMAVSLILAAACVVTLSRGAWLAAITGVGVLFMLRRQFGLMLKTILVLAPILALCWMMLAPEQRAYALGFGGERWNIKLRYESIDLALGWYHENPLMGVGVGLRKEYDATNFLLLTLAETGILGVLALALVHGTVAIWVWRAHLRLPRTSLGFSLVALSGALIMGKLAHGMVDHYWSRGSLTVAWASLGMATFAAQAHRSRQRAERRARARAEEEENAGELAEGVPCG